MLQSTYNGLPSRKWRHCSFSFKHLVIVSQTLGLYKPCCLVAWLENSIGVVRTLQTKQLSWTPIAFHWKELSGTLAIWEKKDMFDYPIWNKLCGRKLCKGLLSNDSFQPTDKSHTFYPIVPNKPSVVHNTWNYLFLENRKGQRVIFPCSGLRKCFVFSAGEPLQKYNYVQP